MSTTKKQAANAAQAVLDANKESLVGFDDARVTELLTAMSNNAAAIDEADGKQKDAAVLLIDHAWGVAEQSREAGATDIDKGWSAKIKAMLPKLAKEGSRFVKVTEKDDGEVKYLLSGYGQNVNSVARGFCQYDDISPRDAADITGNVSYGGLLAVVQERRKLDRTDDEVALAEAREALAESIKAYREEAMKGKNAARIRVYAEALDAIIEADTESDDAADDVDAELEVVNG